MLAGSLTIPLPDSVIEVAVHAEKVPPDLRPVVFASIVGGLVCVAALVAVLRSFRKAGQEW
jgi:hypothetical protein